MKPSFEMEMFGLYGILPEKPQTYKLILLGHIEYSDPWKHLNSQ